MASNSSYEDLADMPCSFVDIYGRIVEDEARCPAGPSTMLGNCSLSKRRLGSATARHSCPLRRARLALGGATLWMSGRAAQGPTTGRGTGTLAPAKVADSASFNTRQLFRSPL